MVVPGFLDTVYCGRYGRARAPLPRLRSSRPPLVRISGRRRAAAASPCRPRCLHRWRRSGGARPRRAAIVPRSLCSLRDLSGMRALPRPSPLLLAAPLPLAAARGCGLRSGAAQSALCPAGPRGGPPAPAGRVGPSPSASAALRLAAAAGGALPRLRSGSGCVSSPSPRGVLSFWGCRGGAPAGAGMGIPPPAGGGDNRPPGAGGVEHLRRHFHIFIVQRKGKGNDHAQHLSQSIHAGI